MDRPLVTGQSDIYARVLKPCSVGLPLAPEHVVLGCDSGRRGEAEADQGFRPGLSSDQVAELGELRRENWELRRTNEILRKASAYFSEAELDRRPRK